MTTVTSTGPSSAVCPMRTSHNCTCTTTSTPTIAAITDVKPTASTPHWKICRASASRTVRLQVSGLTIAIKTVATTAKICAASRPALSNGARISLIVFITLCGFQPIVRPS